MRAQRLDSKGEKLWESQGIDIGTGYGLYYTPSIQVISDGVGGIIIIWQRYLGKSGDKIYLLELGNYALFMQRIDSSGNLVWKSGGVNVSTYVGDGSLTPQIVSDGTGGAIAFWSERRGDPNGELQLISTQRIDASGQALWNSPGIPMGSIDGSDEEGLKTISDGHGDAVVLLRSTDFKNDKLISSIKVRHIDSTGFISWGDGGRVIFSDLDLGFGPIYAVPDDSRGFIVTCQNQSNGDIYAQKINSDGLIQWKSNGITVGRPVDYYGYAGTYSVITDNVGGAIMVWQHYYGSLQFWVRPKSFSMYIQRLDSSGNKAYDLSGKIECTDNKWGDNFSLITDHNGNAKIILWAYPSYGTSSPELKLVPIPLAKSMQ